MLEDDILNYIDYLQDKEYLVEGGFERYLSDKASAQYSIGELEALIAEMAQANRIP
ncbi:hypothetical protein IQ241_15285 [Romeria aff. gracilis LEGE 07310]|uniref:Uncharacterized protein n=1 Tax=Vasconcelosia minhoensis LEGE 07310 TaxID=915328 RepID=A0A8J7A9H3_9CYAN|nr:hypothetical protein [Romeria gracilis]MBE9078640.1 hypothetical protein [Romeria aff. gracilis LEGE 07310]